MNPDDLRHLLSATPDEPPLPADPAALVRTRIKRSRNRRRGTAGALAIALVAAGAGVAVTLPGSDARGGPAVVQELTPSPTPSAHPVLLPTTTPTVIRATGTATPKAPVPPLGLPFTWSIHVRGDTVSYGGTWSGDDRTVSAAALAADKASSTFAEAGSGVLGLDAYVTNTDGSTVVGDPEPVYESNGDIPACSGPVVAQHRAVTPGSITITRAGTYLLHMRSDTCSGERDDTRSFTVGSTPGLTFAWTTHTYGEWVEVQGDWVGVSTASGGAGGDVTGDVVRSYDLSAPAAATFAGNDAADAGAAPACSGAARQRTLALPTVWYRFSRPGTYPVSLTSETCAGSVTSAVTVTAASGDPFQAAFTSAIPTTASVGQQLDLSGATRSPLSPVWAGVFAVDPDGRLVAVGHTSLASEGCAASVGATGTPSGTLTLSEPGTWTVVSGVSCFDIDAYVTGGSTFALVSDQLLGETVRTISVS